MRVIKSDVANTQKMFISSGKKCNMLSKFWMAPSAHNFDKFSSEKICFFHLTRRLLFPLCLWYLTKEICRFMFPWNDIQFVVLFAITSVNSVLFLCLFPLHNSCFCVLSMLIICSRWIQCFPWFSTLTRSPTQTHKASEWVDSFFFAPQEREMIWEDALLHKHLASPCSHSSSSTMSFIWPKFISWVISRKISYMWQSSWISYSLELS